MATKKKKMAKALTQFDSVSDKRARLGMFLTARELAAVTGFGYSRMLEIMRRPGFPVFEGKTRFVDFESWYRKQVGIIEDHFPAAVPTEVNEPFAAEHVPDYVHAWLSGHPGIARALWRLHQERRGRGLASEAGILPMPHPAEEALPFVPRRRQKRKPSDDR